MNLAHMVGVMLLLAVLVMAYSNVLGFDLTYLEALAGLAVLKGIALFLVPEKAPLVLMKSREYEEDGE